MSHLYYKEMWKGVTWSFHYTKESPVTRKRRNRKRSKIARRTHQRMRYHR